jgi:hypothetical protein
MTSIRALKVVGLFSLMGFGAGLLSIFIGSLSVAWFWVGLGAILLLAFVIGIFVATQRKWLSLRLSVRQGFSAALILVMAYPMSVLVMIGFALLYGRLYALLFSNRWRERYYAGDDPGVNEGIIIGMYLAALVAAILFSLALRGADKEMGQAGSAFVDGSWCTYDTFESHDCLTDC